MVARSPVTSAQGKRATSGCQLRSFRGFRLNHQTSTSASVASQIAILLRPTVTAKAKNASASGHRNQATGTSKYNAAAAQIVTRPHKIISARRIESIYRVLDCVP